MKFSLDDNRYLLVLATLILSIKPIEYLALNISVANFTEDLIYPLLLHLIIFVSFISSFALCLRLKKKKREVISLV